MVNKLKIALLSLLAACATETTEPPTPDALVFDSYCTIHTSTPVPVGGGRCTSTLTIDIVCPPGVLQAHNQIAILWLDWTPVSDGGYVLTSYQCNTMMTTLFVTVCDQTIEGAARFQDPVTGGDIFTEEGHLCSDESGD